jgi:hypothetical protein
MKSIVLDMRLDQKFGRMPPPEVLFLHRKLGGLYLLLSRLRATVPVAGMINSITSAAQPPEKRSGAKDSTLSGDADLPVQGAVS